MNVSSAAPSRDSVALLVGVDDDTEAHLAPLLREVGLGVQRAGSLTEAGSRVHFHSVTVVFVKFGNEDELAEFCESCPAVPVVAVCAADDERQAGDALRAGTTAVIGGNPEDSEVRLALDRALRRGDSAPVSEEPPAAPRRGGLLGDSELMQHVAELVARTAPVIATALIRGETGTGKELVARALHDASPRRNAPFVKVHCAALPEALLESELFGYEKGAFTGATSRKPGRVELAEGGTLFLDEIGDISLATQVKLLRLLQDREYERLGGVRSLRADVRFVAATHRDLDSMVKKGHFREDLFYRLNVITLWLPPLRARRDDIPLLATTFADEFAATYGKIGATLDASAIAVLRSERWPGNVRHLRNFVERLVVLSTGRAITADDVRNEMNAHTEFKTMLTGAAEQRRSASDSPSTEAPPASRAVPLDEAIQVAERQALERALRHAGGNRTIAARILGISRTTLYTKLVAHGIA